MRYTGLAVYTVDSIHYQYTGLTVYTTVYTVSVVQYTPSVPSWNCYASVSTVYTATTQNAPITVNKVVTV